MKLSRIALTVIFLICGGPMVGVQSDRDHSRSAPNLAEACTSLSSVESYEKLPLAFIPNLGQIDPRVRYHAQSRGASFFFTPSEAVFVFESGESGLALRLSFIGANPTSQLVGASAQAGTINYLLGADATRWRTGLSSYSEILYRNLWPGIDLAFSGKNGELKYEFRVAPGADPSDIRLAYEGAERLSLAPNGDLQIHTPLGILSDSSPVSYQTIGGRRIPVPSRYALADGKYGFALGDYDRSRPLVIDPLIAYSTYLGALGNEQGLSIAVDTSGSAYITGVTRSVSFPTTVGAFNTTFNGGTCDTCGDVFVTKLNATGSALVYSTYLGGSVDEQGNAIAVDEQGNAYITGSTTSSNFPATIGAFDTSYNGGIDAFVTKLNADGSSLLYSTYLGGSTSGVLCSPSPCPDDQGAGIAVDAAGNAYVTGATRSANFPTTTGAFDRTYTPGAGNHVFVTKLDSNGSTLIYSTYLGGSTGEAGSAIAVDDAGSSYVTGVTSSIAFPTTPGALDTTKVVIDQDVFVTKLNADGTGLQYSTFLGGSGSDVGTGIAIDIAGNAFISGTTNSDDFPTSPEALDGTRNGGQDCFVAKLNNDGSALLYGTYLGGTSGENGAGIEIDAAGIAYVTGTTTSTDFPTTPGAFDATYNANGDVFLAKLNSTGSALLYSTYFGGGSGENGRGVALDSLGGIYVTGITASVNFPNTPGAFDATFNGGSDAFLIKLINQAPIAADDNPTTDEDNAVTISVLANDADPDGDPLTLADVSQGANGSVTMNPDNTVTYSPTANFNGTDSFAYTVTDTFGATDTANVTVTINPVNDPPVANDDNVSTDEDHSIQINLAATDVDNSNLTFLVVDVPTNGTLSPIIGSTVTYTPNPNFNGSDNFTFKANDGVLDSNVAAVSLTVSNVNDAPIAGEDAYSASASIALVVSAPGVLANDVDIDGDALSAVLVANVSNGTLALASDGSFTYTPNLNFSGEDSFSYTAFDGAASSNVAVVRITVSFNLVVFSSTRDGNSEIYSMAADGSGQINLTNHPAADVFPAWSPDGSKIAFSSNRDGSFEIFVMNADGSAASRITTDTRVEGALAWSPDGSRIAFSSTRDGNAEIYVVNADGTGLTRLTKSRGTDIKPDWSPDGTRIVFSSDRKRSFEIYVMNADGTGLMQLTKNGFEDLDSAWSPDGTKIAFSSNRDGNFEIYLMNADGSGLIRLTNNPAADREPAWSRDGLKIFFTSERDGNAEIYVMNRDGGAQTRLTTNSAADTSPDG